MAQWTDESRHWDSIKQKNDLKAFYRNREIEQGEECLRIRRRDKTLRKCRFTNCIYNNDRFCKMEESVINE